MPRWPVSVGGAFFCIGLEAVKKLRCFGFETKVKQRLDPGALFLYNYCSDFLSPVSEALFDNLSNTRLPLMKHIFLTLLAAASISLSPVLTAQSESVPASPLGFIRLVAQPGEVTPLGVSMVNHPLGGGRIESVDGDKIVLNYELPDPGLIPSYLEVTDQESALVGERFDVVSISGTTVTVDTSANSYSTLQGSLPEALVGATLVYRNHVTLGQLEDWLAEGTEFAGSPYISEADSLTLYRKGVPQMFSFDSSGSWMEFGALDATNAVIEPGA